MTYDVENPRLGLEEIHIICLLFNFVVFQEIAIAIITAVGWA
jgi:hypothetical protein